jgi:alpha-mannosidase
MNTKATNYEALQVGTELHYTGDMCNTPATYKIVAIDDSRFGRLFMLEEVGGDRKSRITPVQISEPSNKGSRFYVNAEWVSFRKQQLAEMKAEFEAVQARRVAQ